MSADTSRPASRAGPSDTTPEPAAPSEPTTLVGRDAELATLLDLLEQAVAGHGQFVLIAGDAGMGKTEVAGVIARRGSQLGAAVAWSRCWDAGGAPALWPWIVLLRAMRTESAPAPGGDDPREEVVRRLLAESAPSSTGAGTRSDDFSLLEAVEQVLDDASRERPLVVVFDDLHAADEASLHILRFVARGIRGRRILILGTYLESDVKDLAIAGSFGDLLREAIRLGLPPLGPDAARELCRQIAGSDASETLLRELLAVSEGNPLLLREAAKSFPTASAVRRGDHSFGFRVPRGARDLLRRRFAPLAEPVLRLLAVAAVIGRDFDAAIAGEVADLEEDVFDLLQTAMEAGIVREARSMGTYSFSHVLLRETLYEDLRMSERMKLHARVAETIEKRRVDDLDRYSDQLAHHWFKAAQAGDPKKTVTYSIRAANAASERGAHGEAVRLYQRALKAADLGSVPSSERSKIVAALSAAEGAAADATRLATETPRANYAGGSLRRNGDFWTFAYAGTAIALKDSKGVGYLRRLLENPGREIHVLELAQMHARPQRAAASEAAADAGLHTLGELGGEPLLDEQAKQAYRRRIEELQADIEEAREFNDPERASRAEVELAAITEHLASAIGLGGRDRQASSEAERARLSVSKAIRTVLAKVETAHPELGSHLRATIRTGFYCAYLPDPRVPVRWEM